MLGRTELMLGRTDLMLGITDIMLGRTDLILGRTETCMTQLTSCLANRNMLGAVVPGPPSREVVCYTHALAAASGATGSDSSYSIDTTR